MKIVISADMEGTCGVVSWVQVMPPEVTGRSGPASTTEYEQARARMNAEINAAIDGAFAGGATEVIVCDSHDGMRNMLPDLLDPRATFITGKDKALGMVQGVETGDVDALFCTGFHAKAGTPAAPLAHTWTTSLNDPRFNGVSTGEFGLAAAIAGHFGTPIVFIAGDDKAVAQTRAMLGEQVIGAVVKEGISTFSAIHLHPLTARTRIRVGAEAAMGKIAAAKAYRLPRGVEVQLDFDHQARADQAVLVPGVRRVDERTVAWNPTNGEALGYTFISIMEAASFPMSP